MPMALICAVWMREDLYRENRRRLYELGMKKDDDYARATLLEIGCDYYESLRGINGEDNDKAMQLLAELLDYCSRFESIDDYSVKTRISRIYQEIDYLKCSEDYFERSVAAEDPTGLYLRVIQRKRAIDELPETAANRDGTIRMLANDLLSDFLLKERYQKLINGYSPLTRILIQMLWASYTGWEIIPKSGTERRRPRLSNEQWGIIADKCAFYTQFGQREQVDPVIRYLHALSVLSLGEYDRGIMLIRDLYKQISRRGNWYLICDENGSPRCFRGELDRKQSGQSWGYLRNVRPVRGTNICSGFGKVKFYPENLGWTPKDCEDRYTGRGTPEFWISVSFSGLEVVKPERETR